MRSNAESSTSADGARFSVAITIALDALIPSDVAPCETAASACSICTSLPDGENVVNENLCMDHGRCIGDIRTFSCAVLDRHGRVSLARLSSTPAVPRWGKRERREMRSAEQRRYLRIRSIACTCRHGCNGSLVVSTLSFLSFLLLLLLPLICVGLQNEYRPLFR